MLETLIRALVETYPTDKTRPGVTCSFVPDDKFYVSCVRYLESGKEVIAKAYHETLEGAILACSRNFLGLRSENWISKLQNAVQPVASLGGFEAVKAYYLVANINGALCYLDKTELFNSHSDEEKLLVYDDERAARIHARRLSDERGITILLTEKAPPKKEEKIWYLKNKENYCDRDGYFVNGSSYADLTRFMQFDTSAQAMEKLEKFVRTGMKKEDLSITDVPPNEGDKATFYFRSTKSKAYYTKTATWQSEERFEQLNELYTLIGVKRAEDFVKYLRERFKDETIFGTTKPPKFAEKWYIVNSKGEYRTIYGKWELPDAKELSEFSSYKEKEATEIIERIITGKSGNKDDTAILTSHPPKEA